jgi:hypothetical protein
VIRQNRAAVSSDRVNPLYIKKVDMILADAKAWKAAARA